LKQLNKSGVEELNTKIQAQFGVADFFDKKDSLAQTESEGVSFYIKDKQPVFFIVGEKLVPALKLLLQRQFLKIIVVDMGAIPFVTKGADVMRPGIVEIDSSIVSGEFVCVVDKNHHKPLSVSQALFSGTEIKAMQKGKVLKNLHYVGDVMWKIT